MAFSSKSPDQSIDKAKGTYFAFVNKSTRTTLHCFHFLSSVPPITIIKLSSGFMGAFSRARFILFAYHPAQRIDYKAAWNVNIGMRFIVSGDTGRRSFFADVG